MKITKKICQELKIYNDYDYSQRNPYLWYRPSEKWMLSGWCVTQQGKSFSSVWYNHDSMVFTVMGRKDKPKIFSQAWKWMTSELGIKELSKTPFGSFMDCEFVDKRNKEIEQLYKNLKTQESNNGLA